MRSFIRRWMEFQLKLVQGWSEKMVSVHFYENHCQLFRDWFLLKNNDENDWLVGWKVWLRTWPLAAASMPENRRLSACQFSFFMSTFSAKKSGLWSLNLKLPWYRYEYIDCFLRAQLPHFLLCQGNSGWDVPGRKDPFLGRFLRLVRVLMQFSVQFYVLHNFGQDSIFKNIKAAGCFHCFMMLTSKPLV